jgi:chromosome partitioning protein
MKIIAVANSKGGVGKTTTAISLGSGMATAGLRVLLVDLDSQGHVAVSLGIDRTDGLYQLLVNGTPAPAVIVPSGRANLDILPGDKSTAGVKLALSGMDYRERILSAALQPLAVLYDVVMLDCGPTLDILNVNAIHASTQYLLPVKCDYLAVDGLGQYVESLRSHLRMGGRELAGRVVVIPTMFDQTTRESRTWLEAIQEFGKVQRITVTAPIPTDTKAREASATGRTIWEYGAQRAQVGYLNALDAIFQSEE